MTHHNVHLGFVLYLGLLSFCLVQPYRVVRGSVVTWSADADGQWTTASNWSSTPNLPSPLDDVTIDRPGNITVTLSSGLQSIKSLHSNENLTVAIGAQISVQTSSEFNSALTLSGILSGSGNIILRAPITWNAGTIMGTGNATIVGGAILNINSGLEKDLGRNLENSGTVNWNDGTTLSTFNAPVINNLLGGMFDIRANNALSALVTGTGAGTINNAGTFRKSAGTGTTSINALFNNSGTGVVQVQTGTLTLGAGGTSTGSFNVSSGATLNFGGGTHYLNAGTNFTGSGRILFSGGTVNAVSTAFNNSAPVTLGGSALAIAGDNSFQNLTWSSGTLSGTGKTTINSGRTLTLASGYFKYLGRNLDVAGTVNWTDGSYSVFTNSAPTINILAGGLWNAQSNSSISTNTGGAATINNAGTFRKSAGTGNSSIGSTFNNSGTVEVQTGTLSLTGTVAQFNGSTLTGGTWNVLNGSTLSMTAGSNISTLGAGASVRLSGATATFDKINSLNTNNGRFQIDNGKNFSAIGAFSNNGTLTIGNGSTMSVAAGYGASATEFQNINLVPGGPGVFNIITGGDDVTGAINLGTNTVTFYGATLSGASSLFANSNGLLTFASANNSYSNADLTSSPSQAAIAPLWDDWVNSAVTSVLGKFEDTDANGINDRLIVEWNENLHFGGSTNPVTFQAVLAVNTGTNGTIVFNYPDLDTGDGNSNGASATVGIKDAGTQGANRVLVSLNNGSNPLIASNKAVQLIAGPGSLTNTGRIEGAGTIAASVENHGIISPGQSAGTLTISGSATLFDDSQINIEIGGLTASTEYDRLVVAGSAALNGQLHVSLINGFVPAAGNSFDILDSSSLNGTFALLDLPVLTAGLDWNTSQLYTAGILSVTGLAGDFNQDGAVNARDYVVWRKGLGTTYTPADYDVWRAHFGETAGSGATLPSAESLSAAVPEPAGLILAIAALLIGAMTRLTVSK